MSRSSTSRAARTCSRSRTRSPTPTGCSTSPSEPLPPVRLVDFHCELTSEKNALGLYLDGRVSVVVGTHTHVVTGDERILPNGTAYQTDLGMTGPVWSVIGFDAADRHAALHQRAADPVRGGGGPGRVQRRPGRHRSRPPAARSPVERIQRLVEALTGVGHAADDDGTTRVQPCGRGARGPARAVDRRPAHAHDPVGRRRGARDAGPGGVRPPACGSSPDRPRHAGWVSGGRRRGRRAERDDADPRRRDQRAGHARPRAVGGRAPHPGVRDGSRRRGVRGGPRGAARQPATPVRADGRLAARARDADRCAGRGTGIHGATTRSAARRSPGRSWPPATRRASRTRSAGSSGYGQPAYVRREGLGPDEAIAAIAAAGGVPSWPTSARRRRGRTSSASSSTPGSRGLEVYYRSFDAATVSAVGEVAARSA